MGIWWKELESKPNTGGVLIHGSPAAYSKTIPLMWRWNNPRYLLKLHLHQHETRGCYIRFYDGVHTMQYRKWIDTEYVAVRVGLNNCRFSAYDIGRHHSMPVEVENLGLYKGLWGKDKGYEEIQQKYPRSIITFV